MTVSMEQCHSHSRSLQDLKQCCQYSASRVKDRLGSVNPPLFEIELDHIVIDELHLLLRITDKLIKLRMAQLDTLGRVHGSRAQNHMDQLVAAVRSCGIHFQVIQFLIIIIIITHGVYNYTGLEQA